MHRAPPHHSSKDRLARSGVIETLNPLVEFQSVWTGVALSTGSESPCLQNDVCTIMQREQWNTWRADKKEEAQNSS